MIGLGTKYEVIKMKKTSVFVIVVVAAGMGQGVRAESILTTQTVRDVGMLASAYQYQEPGVMSNKGLKLGAEVRATQVWSEKLWLRGDARAVVGAVNYSSPKSGNANGQPDWLIETRGLIGQDAWIFDDVVLAPYFGLGYRYLFNDMRSSVGGYRRESNYFYLPLGLVHRVVFEDTARLVTEVEYDHLLLGKQLSNLSDAGTGYANVSNNQHGGFGLKVSVKYEQKNWAIGPYANYWNIKQSEVIPLLQNGVAVGSAWEPKNNTVELGFKGSLGF
jgi:hypothetical protein